MGFFPRAYVVMAAMNMMKRNTVTLKRKGRQFDNFFVIGGTVSCRNDNLRCHQWQKVVKLTIFYFQWMWLEVVISLMNISA